MLRDRTRGWGELARGYQQIAAANFSGILSYLDSESRGPLGEAMMF